MNQSDKNTIFNAIDLFLSLYPGDVWKYKTPIVRRVQKLQKLQAKIESGLTLAEVKQVKDISLARANDIAYLAKGFHNSPLKDAALAVQSIESAFLEKQRQAKS